MRRSGWALLFVVAALPAGAAEFHYLTAASGARATCGRVAEGWREAAFDDLTWAIAGAARVADAGADEACETRRTRARFDVGPELARLGTLTLVVRYHDCFVAWLNGVEVARRGYEGSASDGNATQAHGSEAERIYLPVRPGMLRTSGNVLAVEAHSCRRGRAASVEVLLDGADALRIVRGPQLVRNLDGAATIVIESDLPSRAEGRYGVSGDHRGDRLIAADALATVHRLHLEGLRAGLTYHYQVVLRGQDAAAPPVEAAADFHTPPDGDHPLRFVVIGDVRSGHAMHAQLVAAVVAEDPDFVLETGDLVDVGSDEAEWQRYVEIEAPLLRQVAVYAAPGNHDESPHGVGRQRFLSLFDREGRPTWWSFDAAGAHFVILDSEAFSQPAQLAWLKADLAEARRRRPRGIFACMHHGPWSSGMHGENRVAVQDYAPVFEAAGVSIIFSGHDHDYERGRVGKLDYVVSGGGGAELRAQRCGVPGQRPCPPRVRAFGNEHHYVVVELTRGRARVCPKRPDGTPLEPCPSLPLRR